MSGDDEEDLAPAGTTHSEMSGSAHNVVQVRDIYGDVHVQGRDFPHGHPRQLPGRVRHFINRTAELGRMDDVLDAAHDTPAVCVVTGTAGVGKTSLAVHWAHLVEHRFPDGQLYINLRGHDPGQPVEPDAALDQFLRGLGVTAKGVPADVQAKAALFRSLLAGRRVLVLLDNAISPEQVRPLLPGTSGCLALITSRSQLSGLSIREGAWSVPVHVLDPADSTALLREVMAGHRSADDPADLTELARLCAGLPLALRIAADRAITHPWARLTDLMADLRDESGLWTALSTADGDESGAVRAVFAWSYRALTADAARLFRLLGLHPGAQFSLPASAALAGLDNSTTRGLLDGLVANHLIDQIASDRYQFHDLLRAYALDQARLDEPPDQQVSATRRVLSWYLHTADSARRVLAPSLHRMPIQLTAAPEGVAPLVLADHQRAADWYETERANLLDATMSAARTGNLVMAWQLPAVLAAIYDNRDSGRTWADAEKVALEAARQVQDSYGEGVLLDRIGIKHRAQRDIGAAANCFDAAIAAFRAVGDRLGVARSMHNLGLTHLVDHQPVAALSTFEESLAIASELGNRPMASVIEVNLGVTLSHLGELTAADRHITSAVAAVREFGDETLEARALLELCAVQQELGELDLAHESIQRALSVARAHTSLPLESGCLVALGTLQIAMNEPEQALESSQRAAAIARRFGNRTIEAGAFDVTGLAYRELHRYDDAIAFHLAAVRMHRDRETDWELAVSLDHLAAALDSTGRTDEARERWSEALTLLTRFTWPAANALKDRIDRHRGPRTSKRS
ncbi:NB-ARC domain-containing protein [Lentzea sp. NBC_00516]|uniref:ATP-binding protein n=1 Tax=Lentzea sp. NBC_00516 TaxID=2903582 RepID=UPI002E81A24C|nr:tetratricopeptide repeat protein [Lentzea sp. NBC_00516]WUD26466.1 NB-ARC domain-containing protein [Lentzea sp. NBC_00516]